MNKPNEEEVTEPIETTQPEKKDDPAKIRGYRPKTWFSEGSGQAQKATRGLSSPAKKARKTKSKMAKKSRMTNKKK